jgi:hypothetical protein
MPSVTRVRSELSRSVKSVRQQFPSFQKDFNTEITEALNTGIGSLLSSKTPWTPY